MSPLEIIVIIFCIVFVLGVITATLVKKTRNRKKGIISCCDCCSSCSGCCHCNKNVPDDVKEVLEKINKSRSINEQ